MANHLVEISDTQQTPSSSTTSGDQRQLISQKYLVPANNKTLLKGSFSDNTICLWNNLPLEVVDSPTLDAFKSRVGGIRPFFKESESYHSPMLSLSAS